MRQLWLRAYNNCADCCNLELRRHEQGNIGVRDLTHDQYNLSCTAPLRCQQCKQQQPLLRLGSQDALCGRAPLVGAQHVHSSEFLGGRQPTAQHHESLCECSSRFQPDFLDIRTAVLNSLNGFLSNCNDTLIVQLSVSVEIKRLKRYLGLIQICSVTILLFVLIVMLRIK